MAGMIEDLGGPPEPGREGSDRGWGGRPWRVPWTLGDVGWAVALVVAGTTAAMMAVAATSATEEEARRTLLAPWSTAALEGLMLAAVWLLARVRRGAPWRALGLRPARGRWAMALPWVALAAGLLFSGAYAAVVQALGIEWLTPPEPPAELARTGVLKVLNFLVIGLWGPFTEEVFFRGFVLQALLARWPTAWAAAASAALFAITHVDPAVLLPIFVTGLLLAWLFIRTRSIWPPVVAHAAQNVLALTVAF